MSTVSVDGLVLHGGLTSPNGFRFETLVGWYDLPQSKSDFDSRPGAHGSFKPGFDWRESAKFSVEGTFEGKTRQEVLAAKRELTRRGLNSGVTVSVADEDGATTREASLRFVDIDDDRGRDFFRFSMDFISPDPFRYGVSLPVTTGVPTASTGLTWPLGSAASGRFWDWGTDGASGRVTARNYGTAETFSTFEVSGGLSGGFLLTWVPTGAEIRFTRPILDGSTVVVNPRTGRATVDGQSDVSGFLVKSDWWPVLPGQTGEVQFTPIGQTSGTPTLTVRTADAFV